MHLALDLSLGARRRHASESVPTAIVLSDDEVPEDAAIGTAVGTLLTVGGVAPYTYTELTDVGGLFAIDGADVEVAADLTGVTSQSYEVRSTDANGKTVDATFTITVTEVTNDSGIGAGDGSGVDDGGFETVIVEDTNSGLKITGKNGGLAKFIFDIGNLTPGQKVTVRYTADWSQMSKQGRGIFVGFGFKASEDYHFTGIRGDGANPATMHDWRVSGTDFGNRTTGTHVDGGVSAQGTKDGPNWLQIEVSGDGSTYTLRNSADGETWADVFTNIAPSPIADVLSATTFGLAVYIPSADKGVFSLTVTQWASVGLAGVHYATTSAQLNTVTGTQDITIPDLGWTPKLVMVTTGIAVTPGTVVDDLIACSGAADGTNKWWSAMASNDANASPTPYRAAGTDALFTIIGRVSPASFLVVADFVEFIPNGVRINITATNGAAYIAHFTFMGGEDLSVAVGRADLAAQNAVATVSPGFQTNALLTAYHVGAVDSSKITGASNFSRGFASFDGTTIRQCALGFISASAPSGTTAGSSRNDSIALWESHVSGTRRVVLENITGTAFDLRSLDGNHSTFDLCYVALNFGGLAQAWAGILDTPIATGVQSISGSASFTPDLMLWAGNMLSTINAQDLAGAASGIGCGAISADAQMSYCWSEKDGGTESVSKTVADNKAVLLHDHLGTLAISGTFSAFVTGGVQVNMATANGTARKWPMLLVGQV